ncbi:MAG TPA: acyl-CoA dehydrogenase [Desulfobacteraceae bacterium]|nr:acyl-CoA dehydrogenase [Desulfobacteraceae bacterium]
MAQVIADRRDIDFVLYEQFDVESLFDCDRYRDLNRKACDMVIDAARDFGLKEILPTYAAGDREGVHFADGKVTVPECFRRPHRLFVENEWIAMTEDPDLGGQGLPHVIAKAANEYFVGANFAFTAYATLGHGAGKMIELFGTPEQKALFLKKLYTGQWGGSMLLTEPEAGSDVGALTTSARPNPDGTYSITGNKIFITNGEQDLTENIIHPVLARIEGAPAGTRGISIFLVPKYWVEPDGRLGDFNDVVCTGVEEKMGLHGSPTCSLTLGGSGKCRGWLLGEPNQGMRIMFHMMNEARLDVGFQGFSHATAAYLYALDYARQRRQGRDLAAGKNAAAPSVPIIVHPDVRRMLMWMKAYVDGMRSFLYYVALAFDRRETAADADQAAYWEGLIDLLIPVVKSYCSDRGFEVCTQAMQVYGGYGYTREYPVEQLARDCKITSIYEGTNGIQAMDLLGRKLAMRQGGVFMDFLTEVRRTAAEAEAVAALGELCPAVQAAATDLEKAAVALARDAGGARLKTAFAHAGPFLDATGDLIMAWMLLWRAKAAAPRLEALCAKAADRSELIAGNRQAAFYDGQIKTARFFIRSLLPVTRGRIQAILNAEGAAVEIDEKGFGGL